MSSKPVIFCSMSWVTLFSTVSAEAPGYEASIEIEGGAMGGYWETERFLIASRPRVINAMEMTQAKTGRLRKKRDNMVGSRRGG